MTIKLVGIGGMGLMLSPSAKGYGTMPGTRDL